MTDTGNDARDTTFTLRLEAQALPFEKLTATQRAAAQDVVDLMRQIVRGAPSATADAQRLAGEPSYLARPRTDRNHVVLLDGGRGTGKTTVLWSLLEAWRGPHVSGATGAAPRSELRPEGLEGLLPLPVIDLQSLPDQSHLPLQLMGTLQKLEATLEARSLRRPNGARPQPLGERLASARQRCVRAALGANVRSASDQDIEDLIDDMARTEAWSTDLSEHFRHYLDTLFEALDGDRAKGAPTVLVLAIDDADMQPELTVGLLRTLRWLHHPRLAVVLTGDSVQFQKTLAKRFDDSALAESWLRRVIPPAQRRSLRAPRVWGRDFAPLKDELEVIGVLGYFNQGPGVLHELEPQTLREAVDLAQQLSALRNAVGRKDPESTWRAIDALWREALGPRANPDMLDAFSLGEEGRWPPAIWFDLPAYSLSLRTRAIPSSERAPDWRVVAIDGYFLRWTKGGKEDLDFGRLAAACLLADELADSLGGHSLLRWFEPLPRVLESTYRVPSPVQIEPISFAWPLPWPRRLLQQWSVFNAWRDRWVLRNGDRRYVLEGYLAWCAEVCSYELRLDKADDIAGLLARCRATLAEPVEAPLGEDVRKSRARVRDVYDSMVGRLLVLLAPELGLDNEALQLVRTLLEPIPTAEWPVWMARTKRAAMWRAALEGRTFPEALRQSLDARWEGRLRGEPDAPMLAGCLRGVALGAPSPAGTTTASLADYIADNGHFALPEVEGELLPFALALANEREALPALRYGFDRLRGAGRSVLAPGEHTRHRPWDDGGTSQVLIERPGDLPGGFMAFRIRTPTWTSPRTEEELYAYLAASAVPDIEDAMSSRRPRSSRAETWAPLMLGWQGLSFRWPVPSWPSLYDWSLMIRWWSVMGPALSRLLEQAPPERRQAYADAALLRFVEAVLAIEGREAPSGGMKGLEDMATRAEGLWRQVLAPPARPAPRRGARAAAMRAWRNSMAAVLWPELGLSREAFEVAKRCYLEAGKTVTEAGKARDEWWQYQGLALGAQKHFEAASQRWWPESSPPSSPLEAQPKPSSANRPGRRKAK